MLTKKAKDFLKSYQTGGVFSNVDNFTLNNQNKYLTGNAMDATPLQTLPTGFEVMQQKSAQPPVLPEMSVIPQVQPQVQPAQTQTSTIDTMGNVLAAGNPVIKVAMGVKNLIEASKAKKREKKQEAFYKEDLAERKKDTRLTAYTNTPYSTYQLGGNMDSFSAGYQNQQNYNDSMQQQFEDHFNTLNQQHKQAYQNKKNQGLQSIAGAYTDVVGLIKKVATMGVMQEGGVQEELDTKTTTETSLQTSGLTDIYSENFDPEVFKGTEMEKETIKSNETDELMKWVFEDEEDYSPIQDEYMNYESPDFDLDSDNEQESIPDSDNQGNYGDVINKIGQNESGGDYSVVNPTSGTTGKYQFHPRYWGSQIRDYMNLPLSTPLSTVMESFRTDPDAQEGFMQNVTKNIYEPQLKSLRPYASKYGFNDEQLIRLMHYRGIGDTKKRLITGDFSISEQEKQKYGNPSIEKYLSL